MATYAENNFKLSMKSFKGCTSENDGKSGKVPQPLKNNNDNKKYLKGDGTWADADATKLNGQLPSYYAKQSDLDATNANLGDKTNLTTTEKGTIVGAINENQSKIDGINSNIGDNDDLTTTEKDTIVGAINSEVSARQTADNTLISNIENGTTKAGSAKKIQSKDGAYKALTTALLEMVYPVGSIYMSSVNTSPSSFLGGTWTVWGQGRVPVSVGDYKSDKINTSKTCVYGGDSISMVIKEGYYLYSILNGDNQSDGYVLYNEDMVITDEESNEWQNDTTHNMRYQYYPSNGNMMLNIEALSAQLGNIDITVSVGFGYLQSEMTGGESYHTLTIDEMPSHTHNLTCNNEDAGNGESAVYRASYTQTNDELGYIKSTGGNEPHNNLPPYITCYMWKRTA